LYQGFAARAGAVVEIVVAMLFTPHLDIADLSVVDDRTAALPE
jgi:hypothetical protein